MINDQFKQALSVLATKLNPDGIKWAVVGSANMALQGMDVSPRDIDIAMGLKDLEIMPALFNNHYRSLISKLKPVDSDPQWSMKLALEPASEIRLNIYNTLIQVIGERDSGHYVSKIITPRLVYIWEGALKLPCLALDAEAEAYDVFRKPKADKIRAFLAQRR